VIFFKTGYYAFAAFFTFAAASHTMMHAFVLMAFTCTDSMVRFIWCRKHVHDYMFYLFYLHVNKSYKNTIFFGIKKLTVETLSVIIISLF